MESENLIGLKDNNVPIMYVRPLFSLVSHIKSLFDIVQQFKISFNIQNMIITVLDNINIVCSASYCSIYGKIFIIINT